MILDILSWTSIGIGAFFVLVGGLGLIRMPDLFTRLHASSVADTAGAGFILLGFMLQAGLSLTTLKLVLIFVFLLFTRRPQRTRSPMRRCSTGSCRGPVSPGTPRHRYLRRYSAPGPAGRGGARRGHAAQPARGRTRARHLQPGHGCALGRARCRRLAFTEAAVGAGVTTVFMLLTISTTDRHEKITHRRPWLPILASLVVGGLLIYGTLDLPAFGDPEAPAQQHVAPHYLEQGEAETGVPNIVTAVLASYRGFDTLGEVTVIFTAGIGVLLMLGIARRRRRASARDRE